MTDSVLDWLDGASRARSFASGGAPDDDIMDWMDGVQTVQEGGAGARRQPPPRYQPGPINQDALRGGGTQQARPRPRPAPPPPKGNSPAAGVDIPGVPAAPLPDVTGTKLGRHRGGDIRTWTQNFFEGKTDPAYAGVRGFSDEDLGTSANADASLPAMQWNKMMAGSDEAYGNMLKRQLGPAFLRFEQDKHGQNIIVFNDRAGAEQKRYVNQPGLDWQDVDRAITGTVPYMVTGTLAGGLTRGMNALTQIGAQGAAAGGTRYATDIIGNLFMGANKPTDFADVGIMGAAGALGGALARPIGAVNRKFVVEPSIYDQATGQLTAKGAAMAQRAGLDPAAMEAQIAREFARTYAKTGSATEAATRAGVTEFGIPVSRGQLTKDPQALLVEKNTRAGLFGEQAQNVMREFDAAQMQAIHNAALGLNRVAPSAQRGIAEQLNPSRNIIDAGNETLGPAIRQGLNEARGGAARVEREAWQGVPQMYAGREGFDALPQAIQGRLSAVGMEVDDTLMPASKRMGETLRDYIAGRNQVSANAEVFGNLGSASQISVDQMRRRLLNQYNAAAPGSADAKAAKAIYDGFNDWILKSADDQIIGVSSTAAQSGTEAAATIQAAASLRTARDTTKDIRGLFEPTTRKGKPTTASNIIEKVMDERNGLSAEGVVQTLFGAYAKTGAPKEGTVQALGQIKTALDRFGGEAGKQTWNDIRLAYWMRVVQDKQGNIYTPQVMLNNIQNSMHSHGDVMRLLFSREEMGTMNRFAQALRNVAYKDPNPSGTGTAVALSTREFATTMMRAIGWQSGGPLGFVLASALKPIRNTVGSVGAQQLTRQSPSRTIDPVVGPYITAPTQAVIRTDLGGQD